MSSIDIDSTRGNYLNTLIVNNKIKSTDYLFPSLFSNHNNNEKKLHSFKKLLIM